MTSVVPTQVSFQGGNVVSPAAPDTAAPTNFIQLLSQIVGAPALQAITPINTLMSDARIKDLPETPDTDELALGTLGLLPISLPTLPAETAMPPAALATGNLGAIASARSGAAPVDIQLLTDMIQNERTLTRDAGEGLDTFSLPATNTESLQQAKSPNAAELTLSRTIHTPVGSKQWADEIGSRLTVMAEQGKHSASLRLSPEHLGPLEIRIAISDDKASVWFGAAHADTRAAIEHALPRLRELFEAQGMSLTDAGVFQEAPREQPNAPKQAGSLGTDPTTEPTADLVRMNIGLLDAYA